MTEETVQMTCDEFTDFVDLYAIGALERPEAEAVRLHLENGCQACAARLDQALIQASLISAAVPLAEPPAELRDRIAGSVTKAKPVVVMPQKRRKISFVPWLVAAASVLALVGAVAYEENSRQSDRSALIESMDQIADANAQRTAAMLSILQAPGTKQVAFDMTKSELPHGSLFIHKNLGVTMVVAHLPAAPEGWKYESWVVPKVGAPQPVESFATDKSGFAFTVVKGPVDVTQWAAMAVSLEPKNSDPVKPTKVVFASPV